MTTKHTPGPWTTYNPSTAQLYYSLRITSETDGHDVAALIPNGKNAERWEANARLIAAAPDLLAALDEMLGDAETMNAPYRNDAICERARAAIAKATGETSET